MAREPSYPKDAAVGAPEGGGEAAGPAEGDKAEASPAPEYSRRTKHIVTGAAIGIGSAALVAALLYANRSKKGDKGGS